MKDDGAHEAPGRMASVGRLVIGLGNILMRDDGIGVHAVRELMKELPDDATALEVGTDVFSAVSWLEKVPWVLALDAMDAGGPPGTIYTCAAADVATPALPRSLHELGLFSVLEFIRPDRRPQINVLGVQPQFIEFGLELSPALADALPKILEAARTILNRPFTVGCVPRSLDPV